MNLLIICVFFPPFKSSAAIQTNDLAEALKNMGNNITVITPDNSIKKSFQIEEKEDIKIYRFKTGKIRDISLFKRTLNELIMPFKIILTILISKISFKGFDGIIWWSPSIFLTPLIVFLKLINKCPDYLILRDIFPKWAKDLGLIRNPIVYFFFKLIFNFQCYVADEIGIQSEGNKKFIPKKIFFKKTNVEVLNNWYTPKFKNDNCPLDLKKTVLKNKKIFIYAGNIGIAQGLEIIIEIADEIKDNKFIGFLFVGRGSRFNFLKDFSNKKGLENVLFYDQISDEEISNLYKKCFCGLIVLDKRHQTHNIPGKLLSYLYSGLPIFALLNKGNDLIDFVNQNKIGFATDNYSKKYLKKELLKFVEKYKYIDNKLDERKRIAKKNFSSKLIAKQISKNIMQKSYYL